MDVTIDHFTTQNFASLKRKVESLKDALFKEQSSHKITSGELLKEKSKRIMTEIVSSRKCARLSDEIYYCKRDLDNAIQRCKRKEKKEMENDQKIPCICEKRVSSGKRYDELGETAKKSMRQDITKFVLGSEQTKKKSSRGAMSLFLADMMSSGKTHEVAERIQHVLNVGKTSKVVALKSRQIKKKISKDHKSRARKFILRKREQVGRNKMNRIAASFQTTKVPVTSGFDLSPVGEKHSWYTDEQARIFFKSNVQNLPKVMVNEDEISCEHAYTNPRQLIISLVTMFCTQPKLHGNFLWFYDHKLKEKKFNHFEFAIGNDEFPIHDGKASCDMNTFQCLNAPGLIHIPEFSFIQAIFTDKENSSTAWKFLREVNDCLRELRLKKLELKFENYPEDWTIPHTSMALNGTHTFTFGFISKGDLKVHLWFNGCISACMFFNSPLFKYSQEWQMHPSSIVDDENFSNMSVRIADFLEMENFIDAQRLKYEKKMTEIKKDKRFKEEEKTKKISSAYQTIMIDEVNAKAREIETACVHNMPLDELEEYGPCMLHMSTNEFRRWLDRLVQYVVSRTESAPNCPKFWQPLKKNNNGKQKSFQEVPDLEKLRETDPSSPLVQFTDAMNNSSLRKLGALVAKKFIPVSLESGSVLVKSSESVTGKQYRSRLIGENVVELCRVMTDLLKTLDPRQGILESPQEKKERITMHSYGLLLRCLTSLFSMFVMSINFDEFGAQFVGHLFSKLVYRFSLHFSLNTFYLSKVSPYILNRLKHRFQINDSQFLGLGIFGLLQGLEHLNKDTKSRMGTWTSQRPGFLKSLLTQFIDVFIGGMSVFEEFCPEHVDLVTTTQQAWERNFGHDLPNHCSCCGKAPTEFESFKSFTEELEQTTEDPFFLSENIRQLLQQIFSPTSNSAEDNSEAAHLTYGNIFKAHLRLDLDMLGCGNCTAVFQMLIALWMDKEDLFLGESNIVEEAADKRYENDDIFPADTVINEE